MNKYYVRYWTNFCQTVEALTVEECVSIIWEDHLDVDVYVSYADGEEFLDTFVINSDGDMVAVISDRKIPAPFGRQAYI